jgi:hypothetical protein
MGMMGLIMPELLDRVTRDFETESGFPQDHLGAGRKRFKTAAGLVIQCLCRAARCDDARSRLARSDKSLDPGLRRGDDASWTCAGMADACRPHSSATSNGRSAPR